MNEIRKRGMCVRNVIKNWSAHTIERLSRYTKACDKEKMCKMCDNGYSLFLDLTFDGDVEVLGGGGGGEIGE